MSSEPVPDREVSALEAALGALVPAHGPFDRDRVMFQAGAAVAVAARSGRRAWMAAAAAFALIALGEAAMIARGAAAVHERVVVVRVPVPQTVAPIVPEGVADVSEPEPPLGQTDYERLTGQVLRYGLDGLPAPPPAALVHSEPAPVPTRGQLRNEFRNVLDLGDAS